MDVYSEREGGIRKQIVEKDLIECIILLPEKFFYNTGAPGTILILRHRKSKQKGRVLFINASQKFEKHSEIKKLNRLSKTQIDEVIKAYSDFEDESGFCRVVTIDEIKKNNYNLSVTRYVDVNNETQNIDICKAWKELQKLEKDSQLLESHIESYLKEIGYAN